MSHQELIQLLEDCFPDWPLEYGKGSWLEWSNPEDEEWNRIYDEMIIYEIFEC